MTSLAGIKAVRRHTPRVPHRLQLAWTLVERAMKLRYRRSLLGFAWSQLGPLSLFAVLWLVFTHVVRLHIEHYPLFAYTGVLAWSWFGAALLGGTSCLVDSRDLVRQPGFPSELLPVVAVGTQLLHFLLAVPFLLLAVGLAVGHVSTTVVALPLVVLAQAMLVLGPCYVLAGLQVRYRDVSQLVTVLLMPLFYVTPVFYAAAQVPNQWRWAFELNPLARLMQAYRDILLYGRWPDLAAIGALLVASTALAALTRSWFQRRSAGFAELL